MKKYINSILSILVLTTCLIGTFAFKTVNTPANFSGTWKLDIEKSRFGQIPTAAAVQQYRLEQTKKEIFLKWVLKNQQNEDVTSSQKLLLDGTPETTLLPSQVNRTMKVKIDPDKSTLTLTKSYSKANSPDEMDYVLTEVWSIAKDGNSLIIELTSPGYNITAVYDKVK